MAVTTTPIIERFDVIEDIGTRWSTGITSHCAYRHPHQSNSNIWFQIE